MMKRVSKTLLLAAALFPTVALRLYAGSISLTIGTKAEMTSARTLQVEISVANSGSEAASSVQALVQAGGASWSSATQSTLIPGSKIVFKGDISLKKLAPGRYPVLVKVLYTDGNGYPFSALSTAFFWSMRDSIPAVWIVAEPTSLEKQGELRAQAKNLDSSAKLVRFELFAPNELSINPPELTKTLPPGGTDAVVFKIRNFSALIGSTYPCYVVAEYDLGGVHNTASSWASVQIAESKFGPQLFRFTAAAAALILAASFIFLNVRPRRAKK